MSTHLLILIICQLAISLMCRCCHLHFVGEPPSSVGNLEVVRNDTKVVVLWEEPIVTNGGITSYTVEITLLGSNGKLKTSVNSTNVSGTSKDCSLCNCIHNADCLFCASSCAGL